MCNILFYYIYRYILRIIYRGAVSALLPFGGLDIFIYHIVHRTKHGTDITAVQQSSSYAFIVEKDFDEQ